MKYRLLLLFTIIVFAPHLHATKIYKIVDEEGNVTYSQIPPRKTADSNPSVEALHVETGAMTRVTTQYGREYCGGIRLPSLSSTRTASPSRFAREVEDSLEEWKSSLENVSENREWNDQRALNNNRRSSNNATVENLKTAEYQERFADDIQRMRDLRCAISWAEGRQEEVTTYKVADQEEKSRLQGVADELEARLDRKCGRQPDLDPSDSFNDSDRQRWYNCGRDIIRDLNNVNRRIRGLH